MESPQDFHNPIRDDRFSETISFDEKKMLLNGAPPFITKAIAETISTYVTQDISKYPFLKMAAPQGFEPR